MAVLSGVGSVAEWYPINRCIAWIDMHRSPSEWGADKPVPWDAKTTNTHADSALQLLGLIHDGSVTLRGSLGASALYAGNVVPIDNHQIRAGGSAAFNDDWTQFRYQTPDGALVYDSLQANMWLLMKHVPPLYFRPEGRGWGAYHTAGSIKGPRLEEGARHLSLHPKETTSIPPYLDADHPRYSTKLAAAVMAWLDAKIDVGDKSRNTPKKAVMRWLRENAAARLRSEMTENQIEEISAFVNWQPKGGRPEGALSEKGRPPPQNLP